MKIVLRAGGVGSRLWPVSREKNPKQFHALTGESTMLEESIHRVTAVAGFEDIFVSTNADAAEIVRSQHHEILHENIIVEPERKDTAAAIGGERIFELFAGGQQFSVSAREAGAEVAAGRGGYAAGERDGWDGGAAVGVHGETQQAVERGVGAIEGVVERDRE